MALVALASQAGSLECWTTSDVAKYLTPEGGGLPRGFKSFAFTKVRMSWTWQLSLTAVCSTESRAGGPRMARKARLALFIAAVSFSILFQAAPARAARRFKSPVENSQGNRTIYFRASVGIAESALPGIRLPLTMRVVAWNRFLNC